MQRGISVYVAQKACGTLKIHQSRKQVALAAREGIHVMAS